MITKGTCAVSLIEIIRKRIIHAQKQGFNIAKYAQKQGFNIAKGYFAQKQGSYFAKGHFPKS